MLKIALIFYFNFASIMAIGNAACEFSETYFKWKIKKFFDLPTAIDYFVDSPEFTFANSKWSLSLYPNGKTENPEYICMFLVLNDPKEEYPVDFKLGIKRNNFSDFIAFNATRTFEKKRSAWGWNKFIKRSKLLSLKDTVVPEGTITVFCKVRFVNNNTFIPDIISEGTEAVSDNLKDLYTSRRFTDVTLIVKNREFAAHKNVLSCRLTAFGAMLENIPDTVEITDCDPDSFEEFLLFVYTGRLVNVSSKKAMGLYQTAKKYNLPELKEKCALSIVEHDLSIDSFSDIFHFAKLHNDTVLMVAAYDFFNSNAKQILLNENWAKFLTHDPLQGNELFLRYLEKKMPN